MNSDTPVFEIKETICDFLKVLQHRDCVCAPRYQDVWVCGHVNRENSTVIISVANLLFPLLEDGIEAMDYRDGLLILYGNIACLQMSFSRVMDFLLESLLEKHLQLH